MALRIRLQRAGNRHRPIFRIVVAENLARRDGRFVEILGTYNPQAKSQDDEIIVKKDRFDYWMSVGAKPSDTAKTLIKRIQKMKAKEAEAAPAATASAAS